MHYTLNRLQQQRATVTNSKTQRRDRGPKPRPLSIRDCRIGGNGVRLDRLPRTPRASAVAGKHPLGGHLESDIDVIELLLLGRDLQDERAYAALYEPDQEAGDVLVIADDRRAVRLEVAKRRQPV